MNNVKKTTYLITAAMMLLGIMAMNFPAKALAGDITISDITTAVKNTEKSISDLKIEYTCLRIPYDSRNRELTTEEQAKKNKYPGWYKPETGVFVQKGNKIKLERTYYENSSATKQVTETTCYDGKGTASQVDFSDSQDLGRICDGRWHGLRRWFNPILTLSAGGDKDFSIEISDYEGELTAETYDINGKSCRMVKLLKKTSPENVLRSFKVYVDPNSNYAPVKIEKYWDNFQCLENTIENKEFAKRGDVYIPTKALCVRYEKPSGSDTSHPVSEQDLTVTNIELNQGVEDSTFRLSFLPGTKVWDSIAGAGYVIPELKIEP